MKKILMMALAAVMAIGVQATTVSWQKGTLEGDAIKELSGYNQSVSLAYVFKGDIPQTGVNGLFELKTSDSNVDQGKVALASNNGTVIGRISGNVHTDVANTYTPSSKEPASGLHKLGLVINKETNNAIKVFFYINGEMSGEYLYSKSEPYGAVYDQFWVNGAIAGGDIYIKKGVASAEDFASVPEPTVLALLALGVAGLALKRRVA